MQKLIKASELRRRYDLDGPSKTVQHLSEALERKHLRPDNFSIRDLFVSLIEGGDDLLQRISYRKSGGTRIMEAAGAVDTSAFSNITGQIVFNKVKEAYEGPEFLWPELCETMTSDILGPERIPGVGEIGDKVEIVDEGQEYPNVGLNEEYLDQPQMLKRGCMVPVTREIIVADKTGLLLQRAGQGGRSMGINKEKRVLNTVLGTSTAALYTRNSSSTAPYLTSGAYINSQTNALVDYTDVENAWLLLDAMTDPNTGEPIAVAPNTLIVPSALVMTARRIVGATNVMHVDNSASADTFRYEAKNPLPERFGNIKVLSSQYVRFVTGSATQWFFGDFKRAFLYREAWGIETLEAASNSEAELTRDIMQRYRVSEMGGMGVVEPRYVTQNN